ncbi:MAG TPA: hypothetical protein VJH06_00115 [Candidatus Paceibacterota bacterium]
MKEFIKKNFAVLLAFLLPLALILIVTVGVYLPSLFVSTHYNFLYVSCVNSDNYYSYDYNCANYGQKRYSVVNNTLSVNPVDMVADVNKDGVPDYSRIADNARIFLHDTQKNESREISLVEAQSLRLDGLLTSPDGVTVSSSYGGGGDYFFPFGGGSSSYGYYIVKGKGKDRLNLINDTDRYYYRNNFQFIGWVLPGRTN